MQALPAVIAAMPVESPTYGLTAGFKTVSQLANVMIMDQTTVARNLQLLEKRGYIFFQEKGDDLRVKQIHISDSGQQILKKAQPLWRSAQQEMENDLGKLGLDVFLKSLNAVIK